MQKQVSLFIVFVCITVIGFTQNTVTERTLHQNWTFKEKGKDNWLPATVPGCVHTDLIDNGIIEDPFYRLNESKVQWIDKKDWVYQSNFEISPQEYERKHHKLQFEGLDTYASVYLNDSLVLQSNNMHRTYTVDVKPYLKNGTNTLRILLESPIRKGLELYDALDYTIPVSANDQAETGEVSGGKRVNVFTRKAAYHYGWDWGPRLVTSGIWRPITLTSWDDLRITDFRISYSFDGPVYLQAHIDVESSIDNESTLLELQLNDSLIVSSKQNLHKGMQTLHVPFVINNPAYWYPNGMGEQTLYNIKVKLKLNNSILTDNQSFGLRTILLTADSSQSQPNFYFKVNGIPTFAKGVNYIPQDIFLPSIKSKDYEHILIAAAEANMNMIRVWGGGVYEDDRFYELCDSLGLMVWQDFMFACAMYPGDDAFLENVRQEAIDNYTRISKHPSIALWCGNNEVLSAWKRWGWEQTAIEEQSPEIAQRIWQNYDTLFHHILPKVILDYHPHMGISSNNHYTEYWASSPSATEGIPEEYDKGDTHYWGVWWGKEPFENFNTKISSFMSEYGFQSFPTYSSFQNFATADDEDMYSTVMKSHQRSSIGNATIEEYMDREYKEPKDFESLLYTSQLLQADGIRTGIEAHRRNKNKCMGSLYWQLNDCWPGASWSSIDYYGKWKALHYHVKKAFQPIIVSHEFIEGDLQVHVVSDSRESFNGEVEVILSDFKGDPILQSWKQEVQLKPRKAALLLTIPKEALPSPEKQKQTYLQLKLSSKNQLISSKNVYFLPFKELDLPCPELEFSVSNDKSNLLYVTVKSKSFAKGVHVTCNSPHNFSDNFFDLPINGSKIITLRLDPGTDIAALIDSIKVRSLWSSMQ